jgi:hypothetical protein
LSVVLNLGHRLILTKNFIRLLFTPSGRPLGPSIGIGAESVTNYP